MDVNVAKQIKRYRTLKGLTQMFVAEKISVSFQQYQKYEARQNRVTTGVLWEISQVLGCPISYFFEEIESDDPVC